MPSFRELLAAAKAEIREVDTAADRGGPRGRNAAHRRA